MASEIEEDAHRYSGVSPAIVAWAALGLERSYDHIS